LLTLPGMIATRGTWWHWAPTLSIGVTAALTLTAGVPAPPGTSEPFVGVGSADCDSGVFESDPSGVPTYRIPSIASLPSGRIIVFAERRDSRTLDVGDFDIVYRVSDDDGCTWGDIEVLADIEGKVSNPAPIVDEIDGSLIVIMSAVNDSGLHVVMRKSDDEAETWGALVQLSGTKALKGWRGGLVSPGHGLQLTSDDHAGWLVFLAGTSATGQSAYISDDHGVTWRRGFTVATDDPANRFVEGAIAELPDGRVWATFRNRASTVAGKTRGYAVSSDGAATLDGSGVSILRDGLQIVSVYASTLVPEGLYEDLLLLAAPSTYHPDEPDRRVDVAIHVSIDAGQTWIEEPLRLGTDGTPGGYTDLVQLDERRIGVVYETGVSDWRERIVFDEVDLVDLVPAGLWCPVDSADAQ